MITTETQRHRGIIEIKPSDPRTEPIIAAAIEVHRHLGPGLFESIYEECLCRELELRAIPFRRQIDLPVVYKGLHLPCGYRLDLLVNGEVVVELKAVEVLLPVHSAQLMTYMRLLDKRIGLILNFNVPLLRDGIVRKIL